MDFNYIINVFNRSRYLKDYYTSKTFKIKPDQTLKVYILFFFFFFFVLLIHFYAFFSLFYYCNFNNVELKRKKKEEIFKVFSFTLSLFLLILLDFTTTTTTTKIDLKLIGLQFNEDIIILHSTLQQLENKQNLIYLTITKKKRRRENKNNNFTFRIFINRRRL